MAFYSVALCFVLLAASSAQDANCADGACPKQVFDFMQVGQTVRQSVLKQDAGSVGAKDEVLRQKIMGDMKKAASQVKDKEWLVEQLKGLLIELGEPCEPPLVTPVPEADVWHYAEVYADAAGETHFEDVSKPLPIHPAWGAPTLANPIPASVFWPVASGTWCTDMQMMMGDPVHLYMVILNGTWNVSVSDGEERMFSKGDQVLFNYTNGTKGHSASCSHPGQQVSVILP